jgi:hypothetical protein
VISRSTNFSPSRFDETFVAFLIPSKSGSSGLSARRAHSDVTRCKINAKTNHPTKAYFVSWIARIFSLKNSMSRNPYAWRFIVLILLLVPSIGPLEIITS